MDKNSQSQNRSLRNNVIKFPGKTHLKFVPSRARYYLKCPHFLYLSNHKDIYIPYSQIASQKGKLFEKNVLAQISENTGYEIRKAKQVTDVLNTNGLFTLNKQVDTEFYADRHVGFKVGLLKPDLVLSERTVNGNVITIFEIKNSDDLKIYHYLQAYTYKLTLEKLLSDKIKMPIHIKLSMVHWGKGCYPQEEYGSDFEIFKNKFVTMDFESFIVHSYIDLESEIALNQALQQIASLQADASECYSCPGSDKCELN